MQGFLSQNITNAELSTITVFRPIANANLAITAYIKLSLSIDAIVYRKQNIADSFIYFQLHAKIETPYLQIWSGSDYGNGRFIAETGRT